MVRVMFYTGLSLSAVSLALLYLPTCFSFIPAAVFAILLAVFIIFRKRIKVSGLKSLTVICLVFSLLGLYTVSARVVPAKAFAGFEARVTGTVVDWPNYFETHTVYELKTENIEFLPNEGGELPRKIPNNIKIRLSDINNCDIKLFDRVVCLVTFNDLGFFEKTSLADGIYAGFYLNSVSEHLGKNRPIYAVFTDLRSYLNGLIYDNINYDEASIISAVLLGDHSRLDEDFYFDSKVTGVTHMLVVSGMHFGILFQILEFILARLRVPKRLDGLVLIFSVFALASVCGFSPSILRAGFTFMILAVGKLIFRKTDALNSLGASASIILFISPFSAGNIAFALSFLSTFGLIFVCPIFYEKLCALILRFMNIGKVGRGIIMAFCQTFSASICTIPISVLSFGYISTVSLLANLLTGHAMTFVMIFSLCSVILLSLPGLLSVSSGIFIVITCYLVRYTKMVVSFLADLNASIIAIDGVNIITIVLFLVGICGVLVTAKFSAFRFRKIFKVSSSILISFSLVLTANYYWRLPDSLQVVSVGKGHCVLLSVDDYVYAFGAGDGENDATKIKNSLFAMGKTKIDYIVFPSLEKDIAGGGPALLRKFPSAKVFCPYNGDFFNKFEHISDEHYAFYNNKIGISNSDYRVLIYEGIGVIINLDKYSVIIYLDGDPSVLYKECDNANVVFVAAGEVPEQVNKLNINRLILSGKNEEMLQFSENNPLTNITDNTFSKSIKLG